MTLRADPARRADAVADNERQRWLTTSVIHDFNNFVAAIAGHCELVLQRLRCDDSEARAAVQGIRDAAVWGARITRRLMGMAARSPLPLTRQSVDAALAAADPALRLLVGDTTRLSVFRENATGVVELGAGDFEQMLTNLVVAARDAVGSGGAISIVADTADVDEAGSRAAGLPTPGGYVRLAVSDSGRSTTEAGRTRFFSGGFGLAIVHDIVVRNGGAISVTTGPGSGSTFEVYLPRQDNVVLERPVMPDVGSQHGAELVLVVENEEAVRDMILDVLTLHGYTVLSAADGEDALRIAGAHRGAMNLLIVDVVMPGISGEALVQRLTLDEPTLPVLYISGYTDEVVRQQGLIGKGGNFLQKPFSVDELVRKVREALREGKA